MDDLGWSWPAWKFGMKRDDLFTSLHDKYNTFSYTIQDPEAFHHDVYEISRDADTSEDFHRLMADRQRQRLRELNDSLESLAVEIIANPKLMATEQWQHALQLFRTKSFDSIVRFFASYLPEDYLDRQEARSTSSSFSEADTTYTTSTKASSVDDAPCPPFLDDDFFLSGPAMTDEPYPIDHDVHSDDAVDAPLSPPESETMQSEEPVSSPTDVESHGYSATNPPSPSMSFCDSESGVFDQLVRRSFVHDDETSQSDDCDSAVTSVSDCAESRSSFDTADDKHLPLSPIEAEDEDDEFPTAQYPDEYVDYSDIPNDTLESDTPTPRQEASATCYIEYKSVASRRLPSPHRRSPSPIPKPHHLPHRCEGNPLWDIRRSPEEALSKVQKPMVDSRRRPKARRRLD